MSNVQIPNLPAVASLSGEELFEGVQAGSSVKISLGQMIAATRTGLPTTVPLPVSAGGTGTTTSTGTGSVVLSNGPTVSFALGTFGAPSINFTGDTNTGIWSPGADTVAVSTAGTERMRIDSAGNVGIGLTSPSAPVHVVSATTTGPTIRLQNAGSSIAAANETLGTIEFYSNDASAGATGAFGKIGVYSDAAFTGGVGNDAYMSLFTSADSTLAERVRIDSAGRVGIGTTTPTFALQVETNADAAAGSFIRNNSTGTAAFGNLSVASGVGSVSVRAHSAANSAWPNSSLISSDGGFTGGLNISQTGANPIKLWTNGTERMRIDAAGNVGIGVTPSAWGITPAFEFGRSGAALFATSSTNVSMLSNSYFNGTNWIYSTTGAAGRYQQLTGSHTWQVAPSGTAGNPITFSQAMTLHASGGLSIGNLTDPGNTNLSVTGVGSFGLGTALLPSHTFNGDTNTGIYSPGADQVSISTAGVARFNVDANGNASILGVSTESKSLEIGLNRTGDGSSFIDLIGDATYADYGARFIRLGGANANTQINHRGTGAIQLVVQEAGILQFVTTNLERYRIGAVGQFGIGGANFGTAGQAFISGGPSATTSWGTLGLAGGGTGVTTAPAAAAVLMGYTTTATAAGTTTLTNTSSQYQLFTGATTQTITLPVTSTLTTGWTFHIVNNSTGDLTVNSSGGNLVATVIPGTTVMVTCILTSGTTAASWEFGYTDFGSLTGTGANVMSVSPTLVTPTLGTGSFDLGAVATPSITFTGDPNTGIWSPAADTIAVSTGGAERARIDSAGNITQPNAVSGSGAIVGEQTFRLAADGAAIGPTIADFFGPSSAISLEASSVYEVTIYAVFTKTTAGTATWTLTASAAPTRMVGTYQASPITGIAAGADTSGFAGSQGATTAAFAATGSLTTAVNHAYQFRVQLQTNGAANFRLQLTQSLGTATPLAGSYYTVKKISATTGTFVA